MEENTDHSNIMDITSGELFKSHVDQEDKDFDRMKKFENSHQDAFQLIASGASFEKFKEIYGSLAFIKKKPSVLIKLYKILQSKIEEDCMLSLTGMMTEADTANKFNELSKILDQNAPFFGEIAWRPSGNVVDDVRSYQMVEKLKLCEALEKRVLKKEAAVEVLTSEVTLCREKAQNLNTAIDSLKSIFITETNETFRTLEALTETLNSLRESLEIGS